MIKMILLGGMEMSKLKNVIGAKDFKQRVKQKLIRTNNDIKEEDLYFSQTTTGYYMEYKPNYPYESSVAFIVYQDLNGSISVYGNMGAIVPTIKKYENIIDFEKNL